MRQRFTKRMRLVSGLLTAAMVFTFLPFSALAAGGTHAGSTIELSSSNFPDDAFREYLKKFDIVGNDGKGDNKLSPAERNAVTEINAANKNISNLYGIQFFPNLEKLDCDQNNLSSLDVSQNPALKYLYCEQNNLSSLDVSSNSALKYLHCDQNNLSSLDVSQNPALEYLLCAQNKLTSLDVSKNEVLKHLNCKNNQLTNLNVEYTNIDPSVFLSELLAQDNTYPITVGSDRTFNLSTLPGKFEVSKAGNWVGGTVSGNTLKVKEGATQVTYTYDCGKSLSETFTLNVTVGIRIFGDNFPNYEFRRYLKEHIDKNENGYLDDTELNIRTLDVSGQYIANLKGIEYFHNLETLYCYNNKLTSLDVSKNPELKSLWCYNNQLTSLDVSQNAELVELYCKQNNLTSLDVSQNTALLKLTCQDNNLTSLDLTQNTGLEYLSCGRNPLGSLDVSQNINLKTLYCEQSNLTSLDLSQNHKLEMLYAKKNRLTSLDLSQTAVTTLYADDNQIDINVETPPRTFDLSNLPGFDVTKASGWVGGTVDGSTLKVDEGATQVTYTYDCGNGLSRDFALNVKVAPEGSIVINASNFPDSNFRAYVKAKFDKNNDNFLSESERNAVTSIDLHNGYNGQKIVSLDGIEHFPNLTTLICYNNQLTSLDVSKNTGLLTLSCYENNLTSLDVSQNTKLEELLCGKNQLTELDVRNNTALWCLSCYENKLTSLDVSQHTQLEQLDCGRNQLTELDVRNKTRLWYLACSENKLTSLDLSQNTKLNELYCSDNQLTSLDLSQTVVTTLKASGNQISINIEETPRTFDLSNLPGFDASKASGWVGGTVDGSTLKVDEGATQVTYTYDCGKGRNIDFTLNVNVVPDSTVTPPSGGGTGTTTPPSGGDGTGTTTPPSGGGTGTTTPPSGGDGTGTTTPPSGGDGTGTTTPPSGGGTGTTTPPSGGGTGTTTPPSGGGTGTTTPPSGGGGTGTTTPPSGGGTGTTTPPSGGSGGGAAILLVGGAAVAGLVGYGVYSYVSEQQLKALLPEGVAVPENRAQTALLLWNTAGRPEPAAAPAFADVADPDTAKAAQWCVEQNLLQTRRDGAFAPDSTLPAYKTLNAYRQLTGK